VTTLLISALSLSPEIVNLVNERRIPFISTRPDNKKVREVLHFSVEGMKCKACANNVKNHLEKVSPNCKAVVVQEESRAEILCEGESVDPALFAKAVFETTDPPGDFVATFLRREKAGEDAGAKLDKLVQIHHANEEDLEAAADNEVCAAQSS
jgi:copper chaperone CopZ